MNKKKLFWVSSVVFLLVLIAGGVFWFWQRSKSGTIQYQSAEKFSVPETLAQNETEELSTEEGVQEKAPETLKAESTNTAPPSEEKKNEAEPKKFTLKNRLVSFGHEKASGRTINTIVLHSSHGVNGDPYDVDDVIALWKSYSVAPHYMIARDGTVYQLVRDPDIAYHAGDSKMPDGRSGVNNFSIGVEILNTKTDEYTKAQYQAVKDLIAFLENKYGNMKVVGHDTIAPGRKTDPWNFDWSKI